MAEQRTPPPLSDGYHSVNPYVSISGAEKFIQFLSEVFGRVEVERIVREDGTIGHAEVRIGDSIVMMTDAAGTLLPRPAASYLFVGDVDVVYDNALKAGATSRSAPKDQFYGNREAGIVDPWENIWWIATVLEVVPAKRLQSLYDASQK